MTVGSTFYNVNLLIAASILSECSYHLFVPCLNFSLCCPTSSPFPFTVYHHFSVCPITISSQHSSPLHYFTPLFPSYHPLALQCFQVYSIFIACPLFTNSSPLTSYYPPFFSLLNIHFIILPHKQQSPLSLQSFTSFPRSLLP